MKKLTVITVLTALIMLLVPTTAYYSLASSHSSEEAAASKEISAKQGTGDIISVYIASENKTEDMNFRDYIIGVVAAEMPVEFHEQALSAGACAAATLARLRMQDGADKKLKGAVISTDPKTHQAYMTTREMAEKWDGDFDAYYKKLCDAVDRAISYSITYEGELITPVYHAMSTGLTENAENVWGGEIPYLVSVESKGDPLTEKYLSQVTLSFDEFTLALEKEGAEFGEDLTLWIGDGTYTKAGTLKEITIGKKAFSGDRLREIFGLRSAAITFSVTKDGITMSVRGYGHGVGMSQYGANYLAKEGFGWQEILKHYYTGVEIEII